MSLRLIGFPVLCLAFLIGQGLGDLLPVFPQRERFLLIGVPSAVLLIAFWWAARHSLVGFVSLLESVNAAPERPENPHKFKSLKLSPASY